MTGYDATYAAWRADPEAVLARAAEGLDWDRAPDAHLRSRTPASMAAGSRMPG